MVVLTPVGGLTWNDTMKKVCICKKQRFSHVLEKKFIKMVFFYGGHFWLQVLLLE